MIAEERPLAGFAPPRDCFSVSVVNHKGQGCTIAWPLEEATRLFEEVEAVDADYELRSQITMKLLRKYLRRRRKRDAERVALAALSTALASPYCDLAEHFSAAVREHNRAAISVVFGKKRGLVITIAERGFDDAGVLKAWTRAGLGRAVIVKVGKEEVMQ